MMKEQYEIAKRTLKPHTIIRPVSDDPESDPQDPDNPTPLGSDILERPEAEVPEAPASGSASQVPVRSTLAQRTDFHRMKPDAKGRMFAVDQFDNRLYRKPPKGTLRPPEIDSKSWAKLTKQEKLDSHNLFKNLRESRQQDDSPVVAEEASSTAASAKRVNGYALSENNPHHIRIGHVAVLFSLLGTFLSGSDDTSYKTDKIFEDIVQRFVSQGFPSENEESEADCATNLSRNSVSKHGSTSRTSKDKCHDDAIADDQNDSNTSPAASAPKTSDVRQTGGTHDSWSDFWAMPSDCIPKMPCAPASRQGHRSKTPPCLYNACVARPVGNKEVQANPKAKAAMDAEWARLRAVLRPDGKLGVWDESSVREWRDVKKDALRAGQKAHCGIIFGIVVEKNSELPLADPKRKFKGRAVFGGDNVRDEVGNWALFQDLGSCPATMEAARAADAYGCMHGNAAQQCDAEQAYTQAMYVGTDTWVRLPREQWPEACKK